MKLDSPGCHSKYYPVITISIIAVLFIQTFGKIFLNSGDHGRDLYNFLQTAGGAFPYIDFHWVYGPLMPYYYAFFFKLFTPSVLIAQLAWYILFSGCLLIFYLIIKKLTHHLAASISTIIFTILYSFNFHTFNHIGGTLCVLVIIYFFLDYINDNKDKYLYATSITLIFLGLIKFNIMLSTFVSCLLILILLRKSKILNFIFITIVPLIFIYGVFLYFIPDNNIYEIFPYKTTYLTRIDNGFLLNLLKPIYIYPNLYDFKNPLIEYIYPVIYSKIFYFMTFFATLCSLPFIKRENSNFNAILFLFILSVLVSHEYFMLYYDYSLRIWSLPSVLILFILVISVIIQDNKLLKPAIVILGIVICLWGTIFTLLTYQDGFAYLNLDRSNVSVYPESKRNLYYSVSKYIMNNNPPDATILCIPYNALYIFLSKRKSASKYNEFLYQTQLSKKQEEDIINDIKRNNPPYILITTMISEKELGTGVFGKTHGLILARNINLNYSYIGLFSEIFNKSKNLATGEVVLIEKRNNGK